VKAILVLPHNVAKTWPLIALWVADALDRGKADETPDEILGRLLAGKQQLWLAWDEDAKRVRGICITEIFDSARGKACNLALGAGRDFKSWGHLLAAVKEVARAMGCVRLEGPGRKGWERHVKGQGWRYLRTVLEMRLDDEQQQEILDDNV
jgi:predicted small secreted protein